MNQSEIRSKFYEYFQSHSHHRVLSAPLVPAKDPTLLFTNAGMNQFKSVFLQEETRKYNKAVSIQKCMRVSGKHNDFDEVGRSEFHHTFFEMLGNFSFGDYFKQKAIQYAWELLTLHYGFRENQLWVTVFHNDDEAYSIWEKEIGVPAHRIVRLGEKDNFWQMGDTGPCGPCSEIHFDRGDTHGPADFVNNEKRFVEIWNLVFMQYFRDKSGKLNPLPAPSIDTGMGMERLASLLQKKQSNYQTDLFQPIIDFTANLGDVDPAPRQNQIGLNVIADHVRALTFLIGEGILPANDGRGYVLRRLLRRAARHGMAVGFNEPFLYKTSAAVIDIMSPFYPELSHSSEFISQVIKNEEESFKRTLAFGLKRFDDLLARAMDSEKAEISGQDIFKLSDTYGFPLDFAVDLANEKNIRINIDEFNRELEKQRTQSRQNQLSQKNAVGQLPGIDSFKTEFIGYNQHSGTAVLQGIYRNSESVDRLDFSETGPRDHLILVFDKTPFYAESGGQTSDLGTAAGENAHFRIVRVTRASGAIIHQVELIQGAVVTGDILNLEIDRERRRNTAVHHTATHLLHAALRETLGLHVKQSGSYVGPDKLRFDFTHYKALENEELLEIEDRINRKIRDNIPVNTRVTSYEDAVESGALAFFDEKYSDMVRMIDMGGYSKELCGGTHLDFSGEIGFLKILSETSISAGIRRIEAVGGSAAFQLIRSQSEILSSLQNHFHLKQENLFEFLIKTEKNLKELQKKIKKGSKNNVQNRFETALQKVEKIGAVNTIIDFVEDSDRKELSSLADSLKTRVNGLAVLFTNLNGKSAITISLSSTFTDKINAGSLIRDIAVFVNGSGGGRKDFAQAGGNPIEDFSVLKEKIREILKTKLS